MPTLFTRTSGTLAVRGHEAKTINKQTNKPELMLTLYFYLNFRETLPALVTSLEEVKSLFYNGTSDERQKAKNADDIMQSIYNVLFALTLAVLVDVYSVYGKIAEVLQVQFIEIVKKKSEAFSLKESLYASPSPIRPLH